VVVVGTASGPADEQAVAVAARRARSRAVDLLTVK
jgi:hypothetical protein